VIFSAPPVSAWRRKNAVFWDVAPCRSCVSRRFGRKYRQHLQDRNISERGISVSRWLFTLVLRSRIFLPWRWRQYVPPKGRFTQDLHGAVSHKTAFFIVTGWKPQILHGECFINVSPSIRRNTKVTIIQFPHSVIIFWVHGALFKAEVYKWICPYS
jgi:hypothetical protein